MSKRNGNLTAFICTHYCQFCQNDKCNIAEILNKYKTSELAAKQMARVSKFKLKNNACKNYEDDLDFEQFIHKVEVTYRDGHTFIMPKGYTSQEVSQKIWNNPKVVNVEVVFSDV